MSPPTTRRAALKALAAAPTLLSWQGSATTGDDTMAVAGLESRHGGRLGVAVLDVGSGVRIEHRADERFAMCSTFKVIAAALVLTRVDRGEERLDRRVVFTADQLVTYSPVTEKRVGPPGMTVAELCEAALKTGTGNYATTNDVAVAWPPGRAPVLLSVYYTESSASADERNATVAEVARIIATSLSAPALRA